MRGAPCVVSDNRNKPQPSEGEHKTEDLKAAEIVIWLGWRLDVVQIGRLLLALPRPGGIEETIAPAGLLSFSLLQRTKHMLTSLVLFLLPLAAAFPASVTPADLGVHHVALAGIAGQATVMLHAFISSQQRGSEGTEISGYFFAEPVTR